MTNYNDGRWHGWNGGECPVHPETVVEVRLRDREQEYGIMQNRATSFDWTHDDHSSDIIAFRVIKEHREPRDFWLVPNSGDIMWVYSDQIRAKLIADGYGSGEVIHVREVLE